MKIQPQDLRLGNIVGCDDEVYRIFRIDAHHVGATDTDYDTHNINISNLQGMDLSPEMLEKCGFEKFSNGEYCHNAMNTWRAVFTDSGTNLSFKTDVEYRTDYEHENDHFGKRITIPTGRIEHLHQLQNVFYYTFGTELEIEL